MFLTRFVRIFASIRSLRSDDAGVALAAVLGFMAAGVLFSAIIASSVIFAYQFTSTTRSGVQAQASAEAGIAAARAGLVAGTCVATGNGHYVSAAGTVPEYDATVWIKSAGVWVRGCPANTSDEVKILSSGAASSPSVGGNADADSSDIEAILSSVAGSSSIIATGPAIYAYSATGFGGSGTLVSVDGSTPDVLLKTGNVTCSGASSGAAQLVVKTGNFSADGSCVITGNVWVSGTATLAGGAQVGGNVTAKSGSSSGTVSGSIWVDDAFSVTGGSVAGTVTAGQLTVTNGTVQGKAWSLKALTTQTGGTLNGYLNTLGLTINNGVLSKGFGSYGAFCVTNPGAVTVGMASKVKSITSTGSCKTPANTSWWAGWSKITTDASFAAPTEAAPLKPASIAVPDWVDFGSLPDHYTTTSWTGYTKVVMGTVCGAAEFYAALVAIGSNPGLIDARTCTNGISFSGGSTQYATSPNATHNGFTFQNDLAIIANKFNLQGSTAFVSSSSHNLWLINPDTIANSTPDCGGKSMAIGGGFTATNLDLMLYTPCMLTIASGLNIRGQVFANQATISGGATIAYTPVGLPGYDLSTGLPSTVSSTEADRTIVSQRNVQGG
jgi:cytoskeletal protein CcmA (bactofilin family)